MIRATLLHLRLPALAAALCVPLVLSAANDPAPTGTTRSGGETTSPPKTMSLAAALDTIDPSEIRIDLEFVAGDEQEGRDTPSEGQRRVARYISARLERLGWQPAGPKGFFYEYPLDQRKLDEEQCQITWQCEGKKGAFQYGVDYFLQSSRDVKASKVSGKLVFAGKGTESEFDNKALDGRWALCFDAGESLRVLAKRARDAKCVGLVVAPGPDYTGLPYGERFAGELRRLREGDVAWPAVSGKAGKRDKEERSPRRGSFTTVMLGREAVTALLTNAKEPATPRVGAQIADLTELRIVTSGQVMCENVCGLWPGSDPLLGKETILVTAHYDHVGIGTNGEVYNGADDNGSGTCGLMALADALTKTGPMRRSVMLMWVSGEEKGLWGSQAWTEDPFLPEGCEAICNINMDMIGRNEPEKLLVTPTKKRKEFNGLVRLAEKLSPLEGFPTLGSADEYYTRSDHYNFAKMGLPVMFLFDDVHEDYHQPTDDADKIDYDKIRRVMRLVLRVVDGLQTDKLDLK